jgi:BolA protein
MKEKIRIKLQILEPTILEITDVSSQHKGHSGWRDGGETHLELVVASQQLTSLSRIERHKLIYKILENEMKIIHALQISFA